jgi:hypothetical protein
MKKIGYLLEFILIKILFILFQLIGYRLSSNLGFYYWKNDWSNIQIKEINHTKFRKSKY